MKKYMIIDNDYNDKDETKYTYEIGEEILINSEYYVKCVKTETANNELLQYFVTSVRMFRDEYDIMINEKEELLKALRDLNSVKSEPSTNEQEELKFKVGCEVEEILKKYESEVR